MNPVSALISFLVKGLGVGSVPWMPGTWGSLLGIGFVYILGTYSFTFAEQVFITLLICFGSWILIASYEKSTQRHDDQQVVIDEVAGIFVSFLGISIFWQSLFLGFILFRFFDILKPFPISWADRHIPGAFGTLFDDLLAGAVVCALLHGVTWAGWL